MPDFSIIIPIYNAEKTLLRCLDSLKKQTDPDFEAILVENGSTDASNAICRKYAERDRRFRLITMENNCGPSGARNAGLERAGGTFVAFVDSDDFVEPDYVESLRASFQDADVVFFGYRQMSVDGAFLGEYLPQISEEADYHRTLAELHRQGLFGYTWVKAFRRDVIGQHRFSCELNLLEDEVFACHVLTQPRRLAVLVKPIYNYITGNAGSLMGRTHPDYCQKVDVAYRSWKDLLRDYDQKDSILTAQANGNVDRCRYYGFERNVDPEDFFQSLKQTLFFQESTTKDTFCDCVREGRFGKLRRMRNLYRLKAAAANLMKKQGRK